MKNVAKPLFAVVFSIIILNTLSAGVSENKSQSSDPQKLTKTKWISCTEEDTLKKCITLEFTSDADCVFIIDQQLKDGQQFFQPSPRCDYKYEHPNITFSNSIFFDYEQKFYRPRKGDYSEKGIQITFEDQTTLLFIPIIE